MIRRWLALTLLLGAAMFPPAAAAQDSPLEARLILSNPPVDATYHATRPDTPIVLLLQLINTSGAPVNTTDGFSRSEFWRRLYFNAPEGGTIANAPADDHHLENTAVGFCQYRSGVVQRPSIPVVPIEVLPGPPQPFTLEFKVDDARRFFDLSKPGTYTVAARIPLQAFTGGGDLLNDCDQFPSITVVNVGENAVARADLVVLSNAVEFTIVDTGDGATPVTTIARSPAPNPGGWNRTDVTLGLSAVDAGGSGVKRIVATMAGAQSGEQIFPGASGNLIITAQGTTTVSIRAEDNDGNVETEQVITVRIDKTKPTVTPPGPISVIATAIDGTVSGDTAPALATFLAAGTAVDALDPEPDRLTPRVAGVDVTNTTKFPLGKTTVTFRWLDAAGNVGTTTSTVTVVPGTPRVVTSLVGKGFDTGGNRFYTIRLSNPGTGIAKNVRLNSLVFQAISGTGRISLHSTLTPMPFNGGHLFPGASVELRLFILLPPKVQRFSIHGGGTMENVAGAALFFSINLVASR